MRTIIPYDDYNTRIPHPNKRNVIGAITPQFGNPALRNGWKIIEIDECYKSAQRTDEEIMVL